MKNQAISILILCVTSLFCSCASQNKNLVWYQSGKNWSDINRDAAECRNEARKSANPLAMVNWGVAMADNKRQKEIFNDCMTSKGYILVTTNVARMLDKKSSENAQLQLNDSSDADKKATSDL